MLEKNNRTPRANSTGSSVVRQLAPYMVLGSQLAASVLLFGAVGWFIDEAMQTTPLYLAIGLSLGSVAGIVHFLRSVQRLGNK
ncbi:MAG: AtpZ/AtpI family protein [Ignavibacteria bacterium]|nr:AtpZ/AtpI family protein [Ignavibacteria bacterium]